MRQASESSKTPISRLVTALPARLDDLVLLVFEGADAHAFAQAQLASDVAALPSGHWHWTCLLSAQGRVLGFGPLVCTGPQSLSWVVPASRGEALAAALCRYVLRRKVQIGIAVPTIEGCAGGAPTEVPRAGGLVQRLGEGWQIEIGGIAGRILRLGGAPTPAPDGASEWRALDILDGLPRLEEGAVEVFTAHALGLDRVGAFSTTKGCYPGQEIIARTHFLGRNKREPRIGWLALGSAVPAPGSRWLEPAASSEAEALAETVAAVATGVGVAVLVVARDDAPPVLRESGSGLSAAFDAAPRSGVSKAKVL